MKILPIIAATTLAGSLTLAPAHASGESKEPVKATASFLTGAIIGTLAAGPIGGMIGAMGGAFLSHRDAEAQVKLAQVQESMAVFEEELAMKEEQLSELEQKTLEKLIFQVMFHTGADELTELDRGRIEILANYLHQNPNLKIRLDGHADPRGTDEYNNILARERSLSVINVLETLGIEQDRIEYFSHGSNHSTADKGDLEAYALERRVDIEIYSHQSDGGLAQTH